MGNKQRAEKNEEITAGDEKEKKEKQGKKPKGQHYILQVQSPVMGAVSKKGR